MGCSPSAEANAKIEELKKEVSEKTSAITKLKADLDSSMQASRQEEETSALNAELEKIKNALSGSEAKVASLERELEEKKNELLTLQSSSTALASAVEEAKHQVAELTRQLEAAVAEKNAAIQNAQEHAKALEQTLETERKRAEDELAELRVSVSKGAKHRDCLKMSDRKRIGATGKYYCGKRIKDGESECGPLQGSNCRKCQQLDVAARDLPKGFLVNSEGRIARLGADRTNWYCGAGVLQGVENCDGYCGPTNGPNCASCRDLQSLAQSRYRKLIEE